MRRIIAKYLGFYIQDYHKGTKIIPTIRYLEQTRKWNRSKIEIFQFEKFKKIVQYSYDNVPYYHNLFNSIGLHPDDIKSINDIEKIPILTKTIAKKAGLDLYSKEIKSKNLRFGVTGGTTGIPFHYIKDENTRSFVWGSFYQWYNWMGVKLGDPVVVLWGAPEVINVKLKSKLKNLFLRYFENTYYINSFDLNDQTLPIYVKKIIKFKPKLIRGYLSAILQLANYIDEHKIQGIKPIAISSTTETLLPPYREYIEKVFNAPVYDQYGCGECGSIAFECNQHKGLHINMEHVMVEVLDDNNHNTINNEGRIILTDLDNYAMPFIRYENGDIAIKNEDFCSCGINHSFLKSISGRIKDTIILKNGKRVHGVFFTDILNEINLPETIKVSRFQAYQNKPGVIEFRLESKENLERDYIENIKKVLNPFFVKVDVLTFKKLENDKSGKFRYVISENEFI